MVLLVMLWVVILSRPRLLESVGTICHLMDQED